MFDRAHNLDRGGQRAPVVRGVRRPDDLAVVVDERGLDRRRPGVDAQEVRAARALERADVHVFAVVARVKRLTFGAVGEQRRHGGGVRRQCAQVFERGDDAVRGARRIVAGVLDLAGFAGGERSAVRHVQVRVGGRDEFADLAVERAAERFAQLAHEEQWPAEEHDGAVDRAP